MTQETFLLIGRSALALTCFLAGCSLPGEPIPRHHPGIHDDSRYEHLGSEDEPIAARVNNRIITWEEVDRRLSLVPKKDVTSQLRGGALRELAQEILFLQAAKQLNVHVVSSQVDEAIKSEAAGAGGDAEFDKKLRLFGLTRVEARENLKVRWTIAKLYRRIIEKLPSVEDSKLPVPSEDGIGRLRDHLLRSAYVWPADLLESR